MVPEGRSPNTEGARWHVLAADIRWFLRRLPGLFRNDWTAVMLVFANIYPVVDMVWKGEPVGSILVIYWMQMMIIGFWNVLKLIVVARWKALAVVPMFLLMYHSIVNIFGFVAGGLLDDQMRGTIWHDNFALSNYWVPATLFFASHGFSFYVNFVAGREYEDMTWETQMGKPFLRAMPMWLAALVGGIFGGFLNTAAAAVMFVLPVKLCLDVFGHFVEHGALAFDDLPDPNGP